MLNFDDIAVLAGLCFINVVSAVSIHRAIYRNQAMAQRRSLFELLSIIGYLVAFALSLFSVLNWVDNAKFVFFCTAIWALFSLTVIVRLWWTNPANRPDRVLEFPDTWSDIDATTPTQSLSMPALAAAEAKAASEQMSLVEVEVEAPAEDVKAAPASSIERIKARAAQLQQYRHARLLRYKQKRSTRRPANSNLGAYVQKL